ncbi:hemagglutinin repeat-containing protein [Pseudomonas sp. LARHCG127]
MDDRQHAFLARQPSATLQSREQFWGMPKRGLAFLLANVMFWQPMWAQADGIIVSAPGTGLDRAGNGVPIVNIAKPNGSGLSHNQFSDYNVGSNGVILNNATARTQSTQLGGIILGNPNLNGTAATTILNEVNGGNPSQLRGYTEVAGQSAHVIVANPYGITCNGCGFINSPKVTLSTGKPVVESGRLDRYQVDQGSVAIEGAGLNANNVDRFEIITRSAKINAEIQAKNLTIVAGRNDVNANTLDATARADDGSVKPQLAIDSSALGGMYAGAIKLVGTETGVGVKLDGKLIASGGDIQLDANGRLSLAETSASGAVNVKAASLDARGAVYAGTTLNAQTQGNLSNQQSLAARNSITLNAGGQLTNNGIIEAGVNADATRNATGDVNLTAQSLSNDGKSIVASRNLTANVGQTLGNQGGTLSAGQTATVKAGSLDNQNKGRVLSGTALNITADKLLNAQGVVSSNGNLTANVGQLNNSSGELNSLSNITLRVASLDNVAGLVAAGQMLDINASGQVNNRNGRLSASKRAQLTAASMDNTAGRLLSDGALTASISAQLLNQAGLLSSAGLLTLNAASLDNRQGGIVTAAQAGSLNVGTLDNRGGEVSSQGVLALVGTELDNSDSGKLIAYGDLRLTLERLTNQTKGLISTRAALAIDAQRLDNRQGSLYAQQGLNLNLDGALLNAQGSVKSDTTASLKAAEINNDGGQISSIGALSLDSMGALSNVGGNVISSDTLLLKAGQVNNASGRIASAKALDASVTGLDQQNGQLFSNTRLSLDLNHGQLNNQGGLINTPGSLLLKNLAAVNNRDGEISSDKAFSLNATSLDNRAGSIVSQQRLNLVIAQALNNAKGLISANGLEARAASLDNSGGSLGSDADLTVNVDGTLTNLDGEISSAGLTRLNAMALDNRNGQVLGDSALSIDLGGALDNRNGVLGSGKAVDIKAASLDNSNGGQLISDGSLTARISGLLDNQDQGQVLAKGAIDLQTGSLDNRSGRLAGNDLLTLRSDSVDNRGGSIRADKALQLTVDQLDNRDNGVIAGKSSVTFEGSRLDNSAGLLTSVGVLTLKAAEVQNGLGRISSQTDLTAIIDTLQQQGGALVAQGNLSLTGKILDNRNGGLIGTTKALDLQVGQIDNRAGELSAGLGMKAGGQRLDNSEGGKLIAGTDLELKVAELINQSKGLIHAQGQMTLSGTTLDNSEGVLDSLNGLVITLDNALLNNKGLISSEGELSVDVGRLDNTAGSLSSAGVLSIVSGGGLINQGGAISTDAALTLESVSLDNSQKGLISGKAATQVTTGALDNSQGGRLTSGTTLTLNATQVNNASGRIASSQALTASVTGLDQQQGELFSNTRLSLDLNHGQLNNQGGLINASDALLLSNLKDVNNQDGEISSQQAFTLTTQNLNNSGGKLLSSQGLMLRTAQVLNNARGVIWAASLDSRSASLDNSDGLVSSRGRLDLNVDTVFDNQRGSLLADGALLLVADRLDNRAGSIAGKTGFNATVSTLDNRQGTLISTDALTLKAASLDNRQAGLIGATKALDLNVDDLDNRGGELSGSADVTLVSQNLDNSDGGQVFAGQALKLTVDKLLNRTKGLLSAKAGMDLEGGALDNSGGYLISQQNQRINLSRDLLNTQGQLSSEGTLHVSAANLTNTGGSLSSAADLTVHSLGRLDNQGGELVTDGALLLTSAALDNRQQGNISGKGAVNVTTGAFDNSQQGRLNSGSTLNLTAAQVTNQEGGRIGSQGALTASVSGLDQQGGQLFSNTSLSLDMNNGQLNNQSGLINAPGALLLKNLNGVNNQGGEISSALALTLTAKNLSNDGGRLLSNQGLTLRIAQALNNVKGMIGAASVDAHAQSLNNNSGTLTSRGNLVLTVDQQLDNQAQGLISAAQLLTLNSGDLNNQGGSVLAGGALVLNAMALNNSANGLINAQGDLTLSADSLDSSNGGEVSAKGDMNLTLAALTQNGGRLMGEQAMTLNLGGHDLNNRNGLITAKGPLTLNGLRDLNNQGGEVSSSQSFTLAGRTLDNTGGKLISSNLLSLNATSLINQNGLISGWQGLDVRGTSLDNRNNGTLSSRNGDVGVTLSGALLNSGAGALVGQQKLTVSAASLDNSSGGILSSGGDQTLTVTGGLLNNAQGGLIDSGALLVMNAMTLGNAGGTVNAQKALKFTGTTLDNSGGRLVGNAAVTLDLLGALSNTNGKVASVGPLRVERATQISNQGGQIASQGSLTLSSDGLDNSNTGTVAAKNALEITASGAVQNHNNGLIYSQTADVALDAASLANGQGEMQGQTGLKLELAGNLDNQGGKLIAQTGDVNVTAANIDNRGGTLASLKGALEARTVGVLRNGFDVNNKGGVIQGQGLDLRALAGLNNNGGRIAAQAGDVIIDTASFNNRNGGLYASGLIKVAGTGARVDNTAGQIAGNAIHLDLDGALTNRGGILESDSTLVVSATSVDNQTGQLRALGGAGKTDFQIGSLFDNRSGKLESANTHLTLSANSFLNSGGQLLHLGDGTFDISLANVTGAGGDIVTRGGLTLKADTWTNTSAIQAGRLTVDVNNFTQTETGQLLASTQLEGKGGNWVNNGLIASDGGLGLQLTGRYSGNGRVTSLGDMTVDAAAIDLSSVASITGGGTTTIGGRGGLGSLNNYGRLTSASALNITASTINNYGTVAGADGLKLTASTLLNDQGGFLFSGGDMKLRVGSFTNRKSDVYALEDIDVARNDLGGRSALMENDSGTMESGRDFSINADSIINKRGDFKTEAELYSSAVGVRCYSCDSIPRYWTDRQPSLYLVYLQQYRVKVSGDATAKAASLSAGKNLTVKGFSFLNSNSLVSAGGDIDVAVSEFENSGTALGDYTSYQYFDDDLSLERMREVVNYNIRNDAGYKEDLRFWNAAGTESPVYSEVLRTGSKNPDKETYQVIGPVVFLLAAGWNTSSAIIFGQSEFAAGNRAELPDFIKNLNPFKQEVFTSTASDNFAPAIIQAGGNVSITATNKITNGVERPFSTGITTSSRNTTTAAAGSGKTTVVTLNSQLPPDLAQQQINPLTLPGFSLPTGQNGLFRLSGQGASDASASQTPVVSQNWTIGGASVSASNRSTAAPIANVRDIEIADVTQVSAAERQVQLLNRDSGGVTAGASAIQVTAPTDSSTGKPQLPGHSLDGTITRGADIALDTSGTPPIGVSRPTDASVSAPVPVTGQTVARVTGLPSTTVASKPQKYLIETNPVLTNLKSFTSSDYLLTKLGYDADTSAKRLGDGLFEQRLIQQAVVARTGQRFIDGQTSDEAMFTYLMNNAIASKDALNLSVGVTLTAQQVAALTHDIVWLEEHEVNGEKVLVPVLYMAQANNRLAPNGALIQGGDVNLIAGQALANAGTLRATDKLSAKAGSDLTNAGLIEAGGRLDLLAGNNLVNKSGGIIAGRYVSLTTTHGDVINQRDVTGIDTRFGNNSTHRDYLDNASRIEAANDLQIDTGRDINNIGGVIQSGRDLEFTAGRDVNITSIQDRSTVSRGNNFLNQTIKQHGAEVTSGRDLSISAERDVTAIASRLDAKRDIEMGADFDFLITSAADMSDFVSRSKRRKEEKHSVTQQASSLNAGRDIALYAGNDLGVIASRIKAEEDISLDADQDVIIASAQDESSSYYYKKKKGSFGRSKTTEKQSYSSTNVASVIEAGRDLTVNTSVDGDGNVSLNGGRNVTVIGSELKAGNDLVVGATEDVAVVSGTEESGAYSKKTKTGLFGLSKSGKSQLQTHVTQVGSELSADNDVVVIAGHNIGMQASEITAKNNAELHAGLVDKTGDISLTAADDLAYSRVEEYKKKVGLSFKDTVGLFAGTPGAGADITLSASHKKGREVVSNTSVGSQITAGNDAILDAARDINIVGSGVSADRNATLDAGRDVNILAGTNQHRSNSWKTDKSYGIKQDVDSNGFTTFVGNETIKKGRDANGNTAAGSLVEAGHDVRIDAGHNINQLGSDLQADNDIKLKAAHDINILAVNERNQVTTTESVKRNGTTTTVAYNFGKTMDTLGDSGKGEDGVSKTSSVLKTVDALDQFFSGPKFDGHIGGSSTSESQTQTSLTNRPSSLSAGNDISLEAGNDVNVAGSRFDAGHDINVSGRNITLDVAHGAESTDSRQTQSKGGVKGGTTGGFKLGVGVSNAGGKDESTQGTSTATQLNAGNDINLNAKNDLTLIGTEANAERDIKLKAGNDLKVLSAQNASSSESSRRSWGAEGGLILGQDGVGVYGSVNVGLGNLEREGIQQQEAYLYAGNQLNFESGRDTTVAGATLRGDEVIGDVGRNLTVTSVPNTGKAEGKEFDASLTVAVSYGVTVSGSVGYGQTNGKTNWVENQTVISGKNKVDISTQDHTQLDGAVVAADNGNLKLDTDTLGFRDITGKDNEHGYYLNVSGSYNTGGGAQADKPNKGMEGKEKNSWALEGYNYNKDREQILRATVGAGEIVVRDDNVTGTDSTAGLNRDVSKAYEVTRDDEHRTELYVSNTSIDAVLHPIATVESWTEHVVNFPKTQKEQLKQVLTTVTDTWNDIQAQHVDSGDIPANVRKAFDEERALAITKNLVRAGVDPKTLGALDENVLKALGDFAALAASYDGQLHVLNDEKNGSVNTPSDSKPGAMDLEEIGIDTLPRNMGEAMLNPLVEALKVAGKLPVEEMQAISLSIQAIMGPLKLTVSVAANAVIDQVFGEEAEKLKEQAAIDLAAKLTDRTSEFMRGVHEEAKSDADSILNGEPYVVASEFLIDAVLGGVQSLGIKGGERVLSVAGKGGVSDGTGHIVLKLSQGQQRAINKIDNILVNLKESDIIGTLKDMAGDPVPKPGGGYWDHLKEMNDILRGLRNHADTLKGVNDPAAQAARQRALETIRRIESALNGVGI